MLVEGNYRHIEQISVRLEKGPAVSQRVIQTKDGHKKRIGAHYPEQVQTEDTGIAHETESLVIAGIEHDPVGKEELSEYRRLLLDQVMSRARHLEISPEREPSVDPTEMSEKSFVSGLSSKLLDRPMKKVVV